MHPKPFCPLICLLGIACATSTPQSVLDKYRTALNADDKATLLKLSDASFRSLHGAEGIAQYLKAHPEEVKSISSLLSQKAVATAVRASIELSSGHVVHFILEDGAWRVRAGGISLDRFNTPKASLDTFFRAYHDGRLDVLRALIPKAHASRYVDDAHLETHLDLIRARVKNAENRLPKAAVIVTNGDQAQIAYGDGWKVDFVKEGNIWKISDLE